MADALIIDAVRTPSGRARTGGALAGVHPVDLLAQTLEGLVRRCDIDPAELDDVIAGCVTQAGEQAMNIGRSAVLAAGFPHSVPATTVDRQCGSSQQAIHFAAQAVLSGTQDLVVACGVESMSRAPMWTNWLDKDPYGSRVARRYPDGLVAQGLAAELVTARAGLSREELDTFALRSHERAAAATAAGWFRGELIDVSVPDREDPFRADETIRAGTSRDALAALKPAFYDADAAIRFPEIGWHVTAGNSSPLTDGAAAVLLASDRAARRLNLRPRARVHALSVAGDDPLLMLTAVGPATRSVLARAGLGIGDIDVVEVNEAFASVPLLWQREFEIPDERLNPSGGAIALGHPLGASGARLLTTLLGGLDRTGGRYGLQTMCEAGGLANALVVERLGPRR